MALRSLAEARRHYARLARGTHKVTRGPYASLNDRHVKFFESVLDRHRVLTDSADLLGYNQDWLGEHRGESKIVLRPKTTEEVSAVLKFCYGENLAVCPQGGNTGLVAGGVPVFDEIILSMTLMNKVLHVDKTAGSVSCEAGCVLSEVDRRAGEEGMIAPHDLGSKGSCQIGGNVSTCAGGLRLIRYGSMLANTLGLNAVLSDGRVLDLMTDLRKDNTGYHLRQMFIGAEGTLGVLTGVVLQCPPKPKAVTLSFLGLDRYADVVSVYEECRSSLSEILSSCEMLDSTCMEAVTEGLGLGCPLPGSRYPFYMLVETHGSEPRHDEEKVSRFLQRTMDKGFVRDGLLLTEPSKMADVWKVRERAIDGLKKQGCLYTYDVTMPVALCYDLVVVLRKQLQSTKAKSCSGFGHIGDGNLHVNVVSDGFDRDLLRKIEDIIYPWVSERRGSISSEHGIGFRKTEKLHYGKSEQGIGLMRTLKKAMDPKGILNPYKVLPP